VEHTAALAFPSYPLAQVHPDTENSLDDGVKLSSSLLVLSYPGVEIGVVQYGGAEHTTPSYGETAAEQVLPTRVHGLSVQVAILVVVPVDCPFSIMSIVDSELIMVAEVVAGMSMKRSFP
jgi:hypothetical protein